MSDTHGDLGKWYRVEFYVMDTATGCIGFRCEPKGPRAYIDDHLCASTIPGVTPCKHAASAARRLERHRLAHLDAHGRWVASPAVLALAVAEAAAGQPDDPFEGFEQCR